ncbi:hypothetical protein O3G_MSEX002607 [Manduca sexta]|uniref:Peptidase S1 domain-containing protein n=1 Tax=Manduca sexta TaxID=7130 RepID=A0A922CF25_MANSE|nr:hypothetical protein O3G_MSEX002607 [Manduca sexta]KAG6443074.1 hypothetical protein O3G_MSEX002607 [Manduca sexta]
MGRLEAVVFFAFLGLVVADNAAQSGQSRIVSGWVAREGQFPYMMYLRTVSVHGQITACGGSIIHHNWGFSSARCTANRVNLMIRAGMVNINRPRVYFETSTVFTAPGFIDEIHPITQPHDIALIRFNRWLNYDNFVQPIRIMRSADMNRNYAGVRMTTSGWGTTWTGGQVTNDLNWVHLTGVTNFMCMLVFNNNFFIRESTICAGPYNVTSQGICSGDSGVPLTVVDVDGQLTQVGVGSIVSQFGCHAGLPSAFVRPGHYHPWIREVTGINFDWTPSMVAYKDKTETKEPSLNILNLLRK